MALRGLCWPALLPWAALAWELCYGWAGLVREERPIVGHLLTFRWLPPLAVLAGLLLCAWPRARRAVWRSLDEGAGTWRAGPWAAAAGVFAYIAHLEFVRYRSHSLVMASDNADTISVVWGVLHGNGFTSVVDGQNILGVHFCLIQALIAPFLALFPWPMTLFLGLALALSSMTLCSFLLVRRLTGSAGAAWTALFLSAATPSMVHLMRSGFFLQMGLPPLFLWAAYCEETGRRRLALALWLAFLGCSEQASLALAGYAAYRSIEALTRRDRRCALRGLGTAALCLLVFWLELRLKALMSSDGGRYGMIYYARLLDPGSRREAWSSLVLSWSTYRPTLELLSYWALLPLAGGWRLLTLAAAALPQVAALPNTWFHRYENLQTCYVFGPAAWCALHGLASLHRRWSAAGRQDWAPASLLLALGLSLALLPPSFHDYSSFFWGSSARSLRAMERTIPRGSSVWAEPLSGPALAARSQIKLLADGKSFRRGTFLPEYVLMSKPRGALPWQDGLLTLLAAERYRKVFDADGFVVLRHPRTPFGRPSPPVSIPEPDGRAQEFRRYLEREPDFPQKELEDYYAGRLGWSGWVDLARQVGRVVPRGALLVHSGRAYPLPPLLQLFAGARGIALSELVDRPGIAAAGPLLAAAAAEGSPAYAFAEAFGPESLAGLDEMHPALRRQAEELARPYRLVQVAEVGFPGGRREPVLLMVPRDARQARRLLERLRSSGFPEHAARAQAVLPD